MGIPLSNIKLFGGKIMFKTVIENVRKTTPLVHNITNYVTANDCANILIACGGAPIMADAVEEVKEITTICTALNINIGTLNERTVSAMLEAGKIAHSLQHPIVLDPVGAGASSYRTDTAKKLIEEIPFSVIRGNISEIKALTIGGRTNGVDADEKDMVTDNNMDGIVSFAKEVSKKTGAVIAITGATDIIADSNTAYIISNGHPMMSQVSGTGCMLSAMIAAYIGANQKNITEACAAAVCAMGLAGEIAYQHLQKEEGNATYRTLIIDAIYHMNGDTLEKGGNYEIRF